MIKIRLARKGKRNDPFYRIVAIEEKKKNNGEALAILGFWNPREKKVELDKKEITAWQEKGAQVSAAVKKLLA